MDLIPFNHDRYPILDRFPVYLGKKLVYVNKLGKVVDRDPDLSDDEVKRVETAMQTSIRKWVKHAARRAKTQNRR